MCCESKVYLCFKKHIRQSEGGTLAYVEIILLEFYWLARVNPNFNNIFIRIVYLSAPGRISSVKASYFLKGFHLMEILVPW